MPRSKRLRPMLRYVVRSSLFKATVRSLVSATAARSVVYVPRDSLAIVGPHHGFCLVLARRVSFINPFTKKVLARIPEDKLRQHARLKRQDHVLPNGNLLSVNFEYWTIISLAHGTTILSPSYSELDTQRILDEEFQEVLRREGHRLSRRHTQIFRNQIEAAVNTRLRLSNFAVIGVTGTVTINNPTNEDITDEPTYM